MGRAGGGGGGHVGGGGSHSFGGGGSRGFGGGGGSHRSGGSINGGAHRSGASGPSRSYSSGGGMSPMMGYGPGPRPPRPPRPPRHYYRRPRRETVVIHEGGYSGGTQSIGALITTAILTMAFLIAIIVVLGATSPSSNGITKSTVNREPLVSQNVVETGYFTDELGWISNSGKLEKGMKKFYEKTGVHPYLVITDQLGSEPGLVNAQTAEVACEQLYDRYIQDEAHIMVVFVEYDEEYQTWYMTGNETKTVMDDEACQILMNYLDKYYYEGGLSDEEYFSKSFEDASGRIMTVTKSPWGFVVGIAGATIMVVVGFEWWKKKREADKEEEARTEEILNTPLETFGDTKAEDLAKKYGEDTNNTSSGAQV